MTAPDPSTIFAALVAQSGLDPDQHDLAALQDAWERLTRLMDRLDQGDGEGDVPLAVFDPLREL
jgi:hypothetical protein